MAALAIVVTLVIAFWVIFSTLDLETAPRYRFREGRCQGCGYALDGLPTGAVCPECGRRDPGAPVEVVARSVVRPGVLARLSAAIGMSVAGGIALLPLVDLSHRWSYALQLRHYKPAVIRRAMMIRGFDLDWEMALLPLALAAWACGIASAFGDSFPFRRIAWRVLLAGWIASAAWLFLETYLTYV